MSTIESTFQGSRKTVLLFVLLVVLLLFSLSVFYAFMMAPDDSSLDGVKHVRSEKDLVKAVANAVEPTIIIFNKDIKLTKTLTIPFNKDIILTSNSDNDVFFKLLGAKDQDAIFVEDGGVLRLDGVVVTHGYTSSWDVGIGVYVASGGVFVMLGGEISGNHVGVFVHYGGTFSMCGGEISNNCAYGAGGGVYNLGSFNLSGGLIVNNTAAVSGCIGYGGGVVVKSGSFTLSGGEISGNKAMGSGGGVVVESVGNFTMLGTTIVAHNIADSGGGVCNYGSFIAT